MMKNNWYLKIYVFCFCLMLVLFWNLTPSVGREFVSFHRDQIPSNMAGCRRIVSLSAGVTEMLYSLNLQDRIVAVSGECDYPPQVEKKEKIGDFNLNYEKIVNLGPDLVIVDAGLRPQAAEKLRKLNIPVLEVNPCDYEGFKKSFLLIGEAAAVEERARGQVAYIDEKFNFFASRVDGEAGENPPKVFIELNNSPLMTAGGGSFIDFIITKAGGVNLAADLKGYPVVNPEMLLVRDPDVIILTTVSPASFCADPRWRNLKAVRRGRIYSIDPDIIMRPTPRLGEGFEILVGWFYPELNN